MLDITKFDLLLNFLYAQHCVGRTNHQIQIGKNKSFCSGGGGGGGGEHRVNGDSTDSTNSKLNLNVEGTQQSKYFIIIVKIKNEGIVERKLGAQMEIGGKQQGVDLI